MTVTVTGDRQLDRFFTQLPGKLQRGAVRKSARAGGSVMVKTLRQNIKSMVSRSASSNAKRAMKRRNRLGKTTSLAQAQTQRAWSVPHKGIIASVVGGRWPDGQHGHLVEWGHEIVTHAGRRTGKRSRPIPFKRVSERQARRPVLAAQANKMRLEITKLRAGF